MSPVPTAPHAIALLPLRHARANLINHPSHFVPRHARISDERKRPKLCCRVAVANPASLHLDPHFARCLGRYLPLHQLKLTAPFPPLSPQTLPNLSPPFPPNTFTNPP